MKKMISEVDALGNFMKYSFQTYNPDASEEQGELLRDIDTEQLMKRIKKCNDLHQQCVRAMPTSPNVATLERLMDATDYYEKFRKNFYKKVNKISDSISR
ncbi:hypothetical protein, partial [Endozoicomonas sp. SESOKO1]|uniref:hypothetical protein n=1 Tax=Endozoicomonas sp. SESOKO1 TaxID=2828742 RepID=UPI00214990A1